MWATGLLGFLRVMVLTPQTIPNRKIDIHRCCTVLRRCVEFLSGHTSTACDAAYPLCCFYVAGREELSAAVSGLLALTAYTLASA